MIGVSLFHAEDKNSNLRGINPKFVSFHPFVYIINPVARSEWTRSILTGSVLTLTRFFEPKC